MRIMIKKSVADEICRYWGLPLVKSTTKTRRQEFLEIKGELLAHIRKLRKQEEASLKKASWELEKSFALEKAASGKKREKANDGVIRTWGDGKRYKRIAPGKWVRVYNDDRTKGAKQSLKWIERKMATIDDEVELMKFVQTNKERFVDDWGYPLPAVERLSKLAHTRNDAIVAGKEAARQTNVQTRIKEEEIEKVLKNVHRRLASMAASVGVPGGKPVYCGKTSKGEDIYTWVSSKKNRAEVYAITRPGYLNIIESDHPRFNEIRQAVKDYVPNKNDLEGHFGIKNVTHDKTAKKDEGVQVDEYSTPSALEKAAEQFEQTRQGLSNKILGIIDVSDGMTRELLSLYGDFAKGTKARRKKLFDEIFNTHLTPSLYNRIQNGWTEERVENTANKDVLKNAKKYKAELAAAALKNDADYIKNGETSDYYRRSFNAFAEIKKYEKERQYLFDGCYKATRKLLDTYKDYRAQNGDDSEDLYTDLKRLVRRCNNSDSFNNSELHKMLIQDRPDLVLNYRRVFSSKELDAARERANAIIAESKED